MRLVSGWYRNKNPKRDRPTCAAVLVVIALGLGCLSPGSGICSDSHERAELESFCLRNAQGILWELTTSSDHLIVVQAMLGLVMLFTKTSDLRPAGILISVAMRMSQRLQLHSSSSLTQFAANEGNERTRVFWVAYILDRVMHSLTTSINLGVALTHQYRRYRFALGHPSYIVIQTLMFHYPRETQKAMALSGLLMAPPNWSFSDTESSSPDYKARFMMHSFPAQPSNLHLPSVKKPLSRWMTCSISGTAIFR